MLYTWKWKRKENPLMGSENTYHKIFPSVETIETWNSSGDQIILSLEAILQAKHYENSFVISVL